MMRCLTALVLVLAGVLGLPATAYAETYSAPLATAINDLGVASEVRTGYSRDLFPPTGSTPTATDAAPATRC